MNEDFYIDKKEYWLNILFKILLIPFFIIKWIFNFLKKLFIDVLDGVYKKIVAIIVFLIIVIIIFYISDKTHQEWIKNLIFIK